jgi:hypothetical protein
MRQSGYASSRRVGVDDRADPGPGESAPGRYRRDHLAGLGILRDDHARERRPDSHVGHRVLGEGDIAQRDLDVLPAGFEPRGEFVVNRFGRIEAGLAGKVTPGEITKTIPFESGVPELCLDFREGGARRVGLGDRERKLRLLGRVIQRSHDLAFLDPHPFLDEDLAHLARDFRRNGRLATGHDVAGRIEHAAGRSDTGRLPRDVCFDQHGHGISADRQPPAQRAGRDNGHDRRQEPGSPFRRWRAAVDLQLADSVRRVCHGFRYCSGRPYIL